MVDEVVWQLQRDVLYMTVLKFGFKRVANFIEDMRKIVGDLLELPACDVRDIGVRASIDVIRKAINHLDRIVSTLESVKCCMEVKINYLERF